MRLRYRMFTVGATMFFHVCISIQNVGKWTQVILRGIACTTVSVWSD